MTMIGFVGAGQMGRPVIARLLAAGHAVRVYARRPDVRADLRSAGADVVDSARAAAEGAEVVIACLFDDAQLRDVCAGPDGILDGLAASAVLASHVTGRRETMRVLGDATGAAVVDAPMSGTAEDVAAGRLTVLLGGDGEAVARVGEVVSTYASTILPTGGLGTALAVKLVNNLLFAAQTQLAAEAAVLGGKLGIDRALLFDAVGACSARSYAAGVIGRFGDDTQFSELAGPFLRKDVAACVTELAMIGVDAGLIAKTVRDGRLPLHDPLLG